MQTCKPPYRQPAVPPACSITTTQPTAMRFTTQVKSISYLKANAADMLDKLAEQREPVLITQNGEARAVLQDVASYEEMQKTLALLKLLALGQQDSDAGRLEPVDVAFDRVLNSKRKATKPAGKAAA